MMNNNLLLIEGFDIESIFILNESFKSSKENTDGIASTDKVFNKILENKRVAGELNTTGEIKANEIIELFGGKVSSEHDAVEGFAHYPGGGPLISKELDRVLFVCNSLFRRTGNLVTPEMLMWVILRQRDNCTVQTLKSANYSIESLVEVFKDLVINSIPEGMNFDTPTPGPNETITDEAVLNSTPNPKLYIAKLLQDLDKNQEDERVSELSNVMKDDFRNALMYIEDQIRQAELDGRICPDCGGIRDESSEDENTGVKYPAGLQCLTDEVTCDDYDSTIWRDGILTDICDSLSQMKNSSVLLIGEPGVGKSALAYSLSEKLLYGGVNDFLDGRDVVKLNLEELLMGAKFRGELEARIKSLMNFCRDRRAIVFIDDFQNLFKFSGDGSMAPISVIKPYIENGLVNIVGACSLKDYKKYVEGDNSIVRRVSVIEVGEPLEDELIGIVSFCSWSYSKFHDVEFDPDMTEYIIKMCRRYITDNRFPAKAFEVVDKAMVNALKDNRESLEYKDIDVAVAKISGIELAELNSDDIKRIIGLKGEFKKHIIGQDNAIEVVTSAIKRGKAGINDPNKPIASFLFVGPTGVGKTELCKVLSKNYSDCKGKDTLIRVDMSEYSEKHSVSKLFGAPPGYVGYDEGGILTERVKHNPHSVVLFDEIEKAHPEVFNSMLQILDEGELTDSKGIKVNFRDCIIVMTSNAGYGAEEFGKIHMGIRPADKFSPSNSNEKEVKALKALSETFKPEFLNRIDNVVIFDKITKEQSGLIAKLFLKGLVERIQFTKGAEIFYDDSVVDLIVDKGYDEKYNARNIRRTVQNLAENRLADEIIMGNITSGSRVMISVGDDNEIKVDVKNN